MEDLKHWTVYITEKHKHIESCYLCRHYDGKMTEGNTDCLDYILINAKLRQAFQKWVHHGEVY